MKIHHLLYSRSKGKDYRWMIIPAFISDNDRRQLRKLYDLYDEYKEKEIILHAEVPLFFCMTLNNAIVLVNCIRTKHNDSSFRPIFCMQGVAVPRENIIDFAKHVQYLLSEYIICYDKSVINIWNKIDIESADNITRDSIENTISGDMNSKILSEIDNHKIKEFLDLCAAFKAEHLDFALGVPCDMLRNFNYLFKVIFPIYGYKKEEDSISVPESVKDDFITTKKQQLSSFEYIDDCKIATNDHNIKLKQCKRNNFFYIFNFTETEKYQFTMEDNYGNLMEESVSFEKLEAKKMVSVFNDFIKTLEKKGWCRIQEEGEVWWEVKLRRKIIA